MTLNNGINMPLLGLGTSNTKGSELYENVKQAIDAGYRLFDSATIYQNEHEIGYAIKKIGIKREDVSITSKLWNDD